MVREAPSHHRISRLCGVVRPYLLDARYPPHLNICPECAHRNGQQQECELHQSQALEIESFRSEFVEYQFDWSRFGLLQHAGAAVRIQRAALPPMKFTTANSSTAKRIRRNRTPGSCRRVIRFLRRNRCRKRTNGLLDTAPSGRIYLSRAPRYQQLAIYFGRNLLGADSPARANLVLCPPYGPKFELPIVKSQSGPRISNPAYSVKHCCGICLLGLSLLQRGVTFEVVRGKRLILLVNRVLNGRWKGAQGWMKSWPRKRYAVRCRGQTKAGVRPVHQARL